MIESSSRAPDLEAGLAEIDRRLGQIQDELVGAEPVQPGTRESTKVPSQARDGPLAAVLQGTPVPRPPGQDSARRARQAQEQSEELERQLDALAELRDSLLASIRELLGGYQAVAATQPPTSRRRGAYSDPRHNADVTLSAGPFTGLDDVRAFERAIAELPGVREASLRGYEGDDRAIVDVRLVRGDDAKASRESTS